ncbi:MAG: hypothetical protein ACI9EF_002671, partial [Pseudohongiellaceae bacterium]
MGKMSVNLIAIAMSCWAGAASAQFNPAEEAVLLATNPAQGDLFGYTVAISGEVAVVGSAQGDKAHVFRRVGGAWAEDQKLTGGAQDSFGGAVDIDADIIVVGDIDWISSTLVGPGAAHVFRWDGASWVQETTLVASDGVVGDRFGDVVAVNGDTILVGATERRAGYIYWHDGMNWVEQGKLTGGAGQFGEYVALSDDTAVVSGRSSATLVFERAGTTWSQSAVLNPTLLPGGGLEAVAIAGDTLAISSTKEFWIYSRLGTDWPEQLHETEPVPGSNSWFGSSLALSGDESILLVGAHGENVNGQSAGAVHVYRSFDGTWQGLEILSAASPSTGDNFGFSVGFSGDTALVGAWGEDPLGIGAAGT